MEGLGDLGSWGSHEGAVEGPGDLGSWGRCPSDRLVVTENREEPGAWGRHTPSRRVRARMWAGGRGVGGAGRPHQDSGAKSVSCLWPRSLNVQLPRAVLWHQRPQVCFPPPLGLLWATPQLPSPSRGVWSAAPTAPRAPSCHS